MAAMVPQNEPAGEEDNSEDNQHEQQDERAPAEGEGLQEPAGQCSGYGRWSEVSLILFTTK